MANWKKRMMDMAWHISLWSKDENTKVGCVIVDDDNTILSVGYNGHPRGLKDEVKERNERPLKYKYVVHAEINAIVNATRNGVSLKDSTLYCTYFPCNECAKAIINSGIKTVISYEPDFGHKRWGESFRISNEMLKECGVKVIYYSDEHDEFYLNLVDELAKHDDAGDCFLEWDYKITGDFFNPHQNDWNQTLLTQINKSGAIVFKNNQRKGANTIRCNAILFPLIDSLEFFKSETMMLSDRFSVIIDNQIPESEIVVYYNGIYGEGNIEKEYNYMLIKVSNYVI